MLCFTYLFFSEFDTSRLEMKHVADMFDQDNRGLIDWKKFIAALRPDWEEKPVDNDAQKIHDEVKRLVMLCTCRQKFRVFQVGEGKYRVSFQNFGFFLFYRLFFFFVVWREPKTASGPHLAQHRDGARGWRLGRPR